MPSIADLSDTYVRELAAASPMTATFIGFAGYDDQLDDLSPDGLEQRNELTATTLRSLSATQAEAGPDAVAKAVLVERLEMEQALYEAGLLHGNLNVIESPLQGVRAIFDLMPQASSDDWATISRRMAAVPEALDGFRASLLEGVRRGVPPALRQVLACARQADTYGNSAGTGFFAGWIAGAGQQGTLGGELARTADVADSAYADLADFLRRELRPLATERDAVGAERYALCLREFTGADLNLADTYAWGWQEFLDIEAEMTALAQRIGGSPAEAAERLDHDDTYRVVGRAEFQQWMQTLSDTAVDALGATAFDIPAPLRTLECRIAPPGGSLGAYYTAPSDDLSRPGRMWWSVQADRTEFNVWRDVTVVYHEGVPGHHLQIATQVYQREQLNDYQRLLAGTSGHAEGWALYAERLMRELGFLEQPGPLLGMLNDQLFRAARVVLDIGMHLELPIPPGTGFHEGERWDGALGLEFLTTRTVTEPALASDEIDRYLGWPGQAPSYKVGERVWLQARAAARARHGAAFDLKNFHEVALNLGGMGLDPLRELLAAY